MAAENNLHQGHRERMRERIAQQGFESLADHEALEVLLYLTNPRKNTNVMAHALLKRFGSFSRVLDAEEEELCKVEGVGPATARMLHLMPEICKYYTRCRASEENCLRTTEQLAEFLKSKFLGADRERALLMALDSRSRVKSVYWLKEGNSRMVSLEVKDVVSAALRGGTESGRAPAARSVLKSRTWWRRLLRAAPTAWCSATTTPTGWRCLPGKTCRPRRTSSGRWGWSRSSCGII